MLVVVAVVLVDILVVVILVGEEVVTVLTTLIQNQDKMVEVEEETVLTDLLHTTQVEAVELVSTVKELTETVVMLTVIVLQIAKLITQERVDHLHILLD